MIKIILIFVKKIYNFLSDLIFHPSRETDYCKHDAYLLSKYFPKEIFTYKSGEEIIKEYLIPYFQNIKDEKNDFYISYKKIIDYLNELSLVNNNVKKQRNFIAHDIEHSLIRFLDFNTKNDY